MERCGTVAIVGVGLIGGSIGMAIRAGKFPGRVVGIGRDLGRLDEARRLGAIDSGTTDLAEGVAEADVVVVCTPVDRIAADAIRAAHASPASALITDAGSTKRAIVAGVEADGLSRSKFVAAHPIAGSERQGVAHARADLFAGRTCVLTPTEKTPGSRLDDARAFWSGLGCRLLEVDPSSHDDHLARTSHLPHALAAALASIVGPDLLPMAGGAYRDVTRVAGAEATLWTPIFLENRPAVLEALAAFSGALDAFRTLLEAGDETGLRAWWDVARRNRLAFEGEKTSESVASAAKSR